MGDKGFSPKEFALLNKLHHKSYLSDTPRTLNQIQKTILGAKDGQTQKFMEKMINKGIIYFEKEDYHDGTGRQEKFYKISRKKILQEFCEDPLVQKIVEMIDREGVVFIFKSRTFDFFIRMLSKIKGNNKD